MQRKNAKFIVNEKRSTKSQRHKSKCWTFQRSTATAATSTFTNTTSTHERLHSGTATANDCWLRHFIGGSSEWQCLEHHMWPRWHTNAYTYTRKHAYSFICFCLVKYFFLAFLQLNCVELRCWRWVATSHCDRSHRALCAGIRIYVDVCITLHCVASLDVRLLPLTIIYERHLCDYGN